MEEPEDRRPPRSAPFLISPELAPHADRLWTDALTVREWTEAYFPTRSEKTVRKMLRLMEKQGMALQLGTFWRIRLVDGPVKYLKDVDLVAPVVTRAESIKLVDLVETLRITRYGQEPSGFYGEAAAG
jgi:hypothetical protein